MAKKYRKLPVEIEAMQLRWDNWSEMCDFAGVGYLTEGNPEGCYVDSLGRGTKKCVIPTSKIGLWIPTLEGVMLAKENDYIIRGVHNELYPCKPEIFEATYEEV